MKVELAPVVLFVYNRPSHTLQTLQALSRNYLASDSILYIYADGPKAGLSNRLLSEIEETRRLLRATSWCGKVIIKESQTNKGLATSIIQGVTEVINLHGRVIVLEDDLVTSVGFLKYMNDALSLYENEESVMHISGYNYPVISKQENDTIFLKVLSCWGWATWRRAWRYFSTDVAHYLALLDSKSKIQSFNILGNGPFYKQLLDNHNGLIDTWAVKWYASWYFRNGISLFPKTSMVVNIGHDGSGVHCGADSIYQPRFVADKICVRKQSIVEDRKFRRLIDDFYRRINEPKGSLTFRRVIATVKKVIRKCYS